MKIAQEEKTIETIRLNMSCNFLLDPEKIGCKNKKGKPVSTVYYYFRDCLLAPSGVMKKIQDSPTSKIGVVLRDDDYCPKKIQQLPDSFFECLEESEEDYDINTFIQMWKSIGVNLKLKTSKKEIKRNNVNDILKETMDVVLVPIIKPINVKLEGFTINSCLISNSGINTEIPTIANISTNEKFKWGNIVENSVWSCLSNKTSIEKEKFDLKYRINKSSLNYNSQRSLQAIASSLSFAELDVWVCIKNLPDVSHYSSILSNNMDITKEESPNYKWEKFDHNNPIIFSPIEPFVVRDFIENGDRNISLESVTREETGVPQKHPWEIDETYKYFM